MLELHTGDCLDILPTLPAGSAHCCITSPPYFRLRDYGGGAAELGREATADAYIARLVDVFRHVRHVLRDDGTLWIVIGDSYAGSWGAQSRGGSPSSAQSTLHRDVADGPPASDIARRQIAAAPKDIRAGSLSHTPHCKPKDLIGIPWMLAFALRADGWYLRQDLIWHKPNPLPESITDRCTKAHEYLFLLAKSGRTLLWRARDTLDWSNAPDLSETLPAPTADDPHATRPRWRGQDYYFDHEAIKEPATTYQTRPSAAKGSFRSKGEPLLGQLPFRAVTATRNKRSVWTCASEPYPGAHFATYPTKLIEPCILAGSPPGGAILDPFFGAGTTGIVALRNGRRCVGIELNPAYAAMARKRCADAAPQPDLFTTAATARPIPRTSAPPAAPASAARTAPNAPG